MGRAGELGRRYEAVKGAGARHLGEGRLQRRAPGSSDSDSTSRTRST